MIIEKIKSFLAEIGIPVKEKQLDDTCFLPGCDIGSDCIFMDSKLLLYPGDLLHEAGHLAVTDPKLRPFIGTPDQDPDWPDDGEELAAMLWSYAALKKIDIPAEIVFHPDGYKGDAAWLVEQYDQGEYIGLPLLEWMGLCTSRDTGDHKAFPEMIKWIR